LRRSACQSKALPAKSHRAETHPYREALKEVTRERAPLEWARMQNNLGLALFKLGELEGRTGKLEEAVAAYREALKERTRERVPLQWAAKAAPHWHDKAQQYLARCLALLGQRRKP
jgi:tetratricopeptide (TPR) repeat protein